MDKIINVDMKQLIKEITQHLEPEIIDFYNEQCKEPNYPIASINALVDIAMIRTFSNCEAWEEFEKIGASLKCKRKNQRKCWFRRMEADLKILPPDDKDFPFNKLFMIKSILKKNEWIALYGEVTLDELIEQMRMNADKWQKDSNSLLISFPAIDSFGKDRRYRALLSDISLNIYNFVEQKYRIFSSNESSKERIDIMPEQDEKLVDIYDPSTKRKISALDTIDLQILILLIQRIGADFGKTRQSRVKRSELVKILHRRPSKKHYMAMQERCLRMGRLSLMLINKGISFHLFDSVDVSEPKYITFTYGTFLYDAIVSNNLINVKSSYVRKLERPLSHILIFSLAKERNNLSVKLANENIKNPINMCKELPYSFFRNHVYFENSDKKINMDLIEQTLNEFVDRKIFISSFERLKNDERFRINFFPLTDAEIEDLQYKRFKIQI